MKKTMRRVACLGLLAMPSLAWAADAPIAVLTYLHLKPGTETRFKAELAKIVEPSRSEPGNIAWYVQQSTEDPTEIVFYTRWTNQAALDWHLQSPPVAEYIRNTAPMLSEPARLLKLRPLESEN